MIDTDLDEQCMCQFTVSKMFEQRKMTLLLASVAHEIWVWDFKNGVSWKSRLFFLPLQAPLGVSGQSVPRSVHLGDHVAGCQGLHPSHQSPCCAALLSQENGHTHDPMACGNKRKCWASVQWLEERAACEEGCWTA